METYTNVNTADGDYDSGSTEDDQLQLDSIDDLATQMTAEPLTTYIYVPYENFLVRFFVLFASCFLFFTVTIIDDLISAAVPTLKAHDNLTSEDISLLYSASPVAALFASLAISILVNKFTIRSLCFISVLVLLLGNTIFIYATNYWWKFIGRFILGLGTGPIEILMALILMRWFTENDALHPTLEFSFGFTAASGMLGASVGLIVIPWLLEVCAPNDILAYSIVNTVAGFLAMVSIVYWLVDYWADDYLEEKNKSPDESNDVIQLSIWEITKSLKRSYWLIFGMTGSLWSMIYVIVVFVTDYLTEKWDMSEQDAGFYSSAIFFVGVPSSIATGWFISKYGHTLSIISLAGALYTWSCMILSLTTINPMFGLIGLGVATGLFEPTANTAIARVLPEEGSDTAYSYTAIIFQLVLFVAPFFFGVVHDWTDANSVTWQSYDIVFFVGSFIGIFNIVLVVALAYDSPFLEKVDLEEDPNGEATESTADILSVWELEGESEWVQIFRECAFLVNCFSGACYLASLIYLGFGPENILPAWMAIMFMLPGIYALVNGVFNIYGVDWLYKRSFITLNFPTYLTFGSNLVGMIICVVTGLVFVCYYWQIVTGQVESDNSSYYYLIIISLILMVPSQLIFFGLSMRIGYKSIFQNIYFRMRGGSYLNENSPMIRDRNSLVSEEESLEFSKLR